MVKMKVTNFIRDEDAVSPVIGVILMVAITVILAAVIGTFVLGLGGSTTSAPQASFTFEQTTQTYDDGTDNVDLTAVTVTHDGGDTIASSNLELTVGGNPTVGVDSTSGGSWVADTNGFPSDVTAGSSTTIVAEYTGASGSGASGALGVDTTPTNELSGNYDGFESGDSIRVVWSSPESDTTATLGEFEI